MSARLLLIDDDARLSAMVGDYLRGSGYKVEVAGSLAQGRERLAGEAYDALVLDLMLPDGDGLDLCRELRGNPRTRQLPLLMLTARGEPMDRIVGLELGADDYLPKPFHFEELLARMRALSRRGGAERMEMLRFGEISMDRLRHVVQVGGRPLDVTAKEFQLLEYFMLHPEEVVRRTTLLEKVWDMHFDPESNVVDVHVGNLRRKMREVTNTQRIETIRGVGFSLRHAAAGAVRETAARAS